MKLMQGKYKEKHTNSKITKKSAPATYLH